MKNRALLRYAIPVDLAIVATGFGLLFHSRATVLAFFAVAALVSAWYGGWKAGALAALLSGVLLKFAFGEVIAWAQIPLFVAVVGSAVALFDLARISLARSRARERAAAAARAAVGDETLADRSRRVRRVSEADAPPQVPELSAAAGSRMPLKWLLAVLVAVLYSNVSDVLLRHFDVPSPLQLLIGFAALALFFMRRKLQPSRAIFHPIAIPAIVYVLLVFASTIWARDLEWADQKALESWKGLALFFVIASLAFSWRSLRAAVSVIIATAALLGAVSAVQIALGATSSSFGGMARVVSGTIYGEVAEARAAGPVADPNFYGQVLLVALPLAVLAGLKQKRGRVRAIYFVATLLIAAGILSTYSRGAFLTIAALLLLLPLFIRVPRLYLAEVAATVALAIMLLPGDVVRRVATVQAVLPSHSSAAARHDSSVDKRKLVMAVGVRMFDEHPLFGIGAGNFGELYAQYANLVGSSYPQYDDPGARQFPHNLYIELASETGLAGLAAFVALAVSALVSLWRSRMLLLTRGEERLALYPAAVFLSIASYLISSIFLHGAYQRYAWLLFALAPAISRLAREVPIEAASERIA